MISLENALYLGLGLAAGALFFRYSSSFGRARRKMLANGLIIAALIYVVFAALVGDLLWFGYECLGVLFFAFLARRSLEKDVVWLGLGWALHPAWDFGLHAKGHGAAIAPTWYVLACLSFDLLVAALIFKNRRAL